MMIICTSCTFHHAHSNYIWEEHGGHLTEQNPPLYTRLRQRRIEGVRRLLKGTVPRSILVISKSLMRRSTVAARRSEELLALWLNVKAGKS